MRSSTSQNRPYPRIADAELEVGILRPQTRRRPQLSARWQLGKDGKLTCCWEKLD